MSDLKPFSGVVYVHTCTANEKSYVGQTTQGVDKRWKLHLRCARSPRTPAYVGLIARAIRKYGSDAFEHQVLSRARSQSELDNLEKVWIILLQSKAPNGYNLSDGGYAAAGHVVSPEVRARLSEAQKENWKDPYLRSRYSSGHLGTKSTPEQIEARCASLRGKKQSSETIAKRVAKTTGLKRTPEFSAACAARMTGRKLSEATRRKMSISQTVRQTGKGKEPNGSKIIAE